MENENKIVCEMRLEKTTPGALKYRTIVDDRFVDQNDVPVNSIYIRKAMMLKEAPDKIKITIEPVS